MTHAHFSDHEWADDLYSIAWNCWCPLAWSTWQDVNVSGIPYNVPKKWWTGLCSEPSFPTPKTKFSAVPVHRARSSTISRFTLRWIDRWVATIWTPYLVGAHQLTVHLYVHTTHAYCIVLIEPSDAPSKCSGHFPWGVTSRRSNSISLKSLSSKWYQPILRLRLCSAAKLNLLLNELTVKEKIDSRRRMKGVNWSTQSCSEPRCLRLLPLINSTGISGSSFSSSEKRPAVPYSSPFRRSFATHVSYTVEVKQYHPYSIALVSVANSRFYRRVIRGSTFTVQTTEITHEYSMWIPFLNHGRHTHEPSTKSGLETPVMQWTSKGHHRWPARSPAGSFCWNTGLWTRRRRQVPRRSCSWSLLPTWLWLWLCLQLAHRVRS